MRTTLYLYPWTYGFKSPADFPQCLDTGRINRTFRQRASVEQKIGGIRFGLDEHFHHLICGFMVAVIRAVIAYKQRIQPTVHQETKFSVTEPFQRGFTRIFAYKSSWDGQVVQALSFIVTVSLSAGEDLTPRIFVACAGW
jgi:hypothetical protein